MAKKNGEEFDWQTESDMRTLAEAEAIKRDPKRLKAAQECARKKLSDLKEVATLTGDDC